MAAAPSSRVPAALFVDGEYLAARVQLPVNILTQLQQQQQQQHHASQHQPVCNMLGALAAQAFMSGTTLPAPCQFRVKVAAFADSDASSPSAHATNRRLWISVLTSLGFTVASVVSSCAGSVAAARSSAQCALAAQLVRTAWKMPQLGVHVILGTELPGAEPMLKELRDVEGRDIFIATVTPGEVKPELAACSGSSDLAATMASARDSSLQNKFLIFLGASAEAIAAAGTVLPPLSVLTTVPNTASATSSSITVPARSSAGGAAAFSTSARDFLATLDLSAAVGGGGGSFSPAFSSPKMPPPLPSMPSPFGDDTIKSHVEPAPPPAYAAGHSSTTAANSSTSASGAATEQAVKSAGSSEPDLSAFKVHLSVLGWEMFYESSAQRPYYYHSHSKTTTWQHPSGTERQRDVDIAVARWLMQKQTENQARQQHHHVDANPPPAAAAAIPSSSSATPAASSSAATIGALFQRETPDQRGLTVPVAPPAPAPAVHSATPAVPPSHIYSSLLRPVATDKPAASAAAPSGVPTSATAGASLTTGPKQDHQHQPAALNAQPTPSPPAQAADTHASTTRLPYNWEEGTDPATGRKFYIDHNTHRTTWERPPA